jgi:NADPH:quinone reductase-like Zn-dependent oxidoreductase
VKAITYSEYGSPDVLELTDQPMPKVLDEHEIQVEVAEALLKAKAADAFRLNMEGRTRGKIVVTVES